MLDSFDVEKHMEKASDLIGGPFKLTALLQKRVRALKRGAQPMVKGSSDYFDIAFAEILEGKVELRESSRAKSEADESEDDS